MLDNIRFYWNFWPIDVLNKKDIICETLNCPWSNQRKSNFIESILMRVPIGPFYFIESLDGKLKIVDGIKRFLTIKQYLENEFYLIDVDPEIEGRRFEDLSAKYQNRIELTGISCHIFILEVETTSEIISDVLERIKK